MRISLPITSQCGMAKVKTMFGLRNDVSAVLGD